MYRQTNILDVRVFKYNFGLQQEEESRLVYMVYVSCFLPVLPSKNELWKKLAFLRIKSQNFEKVYKIQVKNYAILL